MKKKLFILMCSLAFCLSAGAYTYVGVNPGNATWGSRPIYQPQSGSAMQAQYFGSTSSYMPHERQMIFTSVFGSTSMMVEEAIGSDYNLVALNEEQAIRNMRNVRPSSWDDPQTPVGDIPFVLMFALLAAYAYRLYRRKRQTV